MNTNTATDVSDFENTIVATAEPVSGSERNTAIDKLRGVAVLGILVMNIYVFSMPFSAYSNPTAYGGMEPINVLTWFATNIFFELKFMAIFSMLFGGGLIMTMQRAEARGVRYASTWYRRCFWLMVLGSLHGYFLWVGDILFGYGLLGMVIFLFRNRPPGALIFSAIVVMSIAPLFALSGGIYVEKLGAAMVEIEAVQAAGDKLSEEQLEIVAQWEDASVWLGDPEEQVAEELDGYHQGYVDIVKFRAPTYFTLQADGVYGFMAWRAGGLMLLGMALMKLGVLSGDRSMSCYRKLLLAGYGIGLPIVTYGAFSLRAHDWEHVWAFSVGSLPNYVGSVLVALGHIGLIMLAVKSGALSRLMDRFAAVGRMAFTNYLMHSLILTTVFYGYGLGMYGNVSRFQQMGFVVAVIALQLAYSPAWLRHFRFGPAEWLWRSLTYGKRQPMRRTVA